MTSNNTPPPNLTPEAKAHLVALCAELEDAAHDGDWTVRILERIGTEVHPAVAQFMAEGLVEDGFAPLSERMGAGDPTAYTTVAGLVAKFGNGGTQ